MFPGSASERASRRRSIGFWFVLILGIVIAVLGGMETFRYGRGSRWFDRAL